MALQIGTYTLAAGQEYTWAYWWGPDAAPYYIGPRVANPRPPLPPGGAILAIGQGIRNIGTAVDQRIQYLVKFRNVGGGTTSFRADVGALT